jgi:cell division inhibitor SepF
VSALRKAGVWLGLIEDEDERYEDERGYDGSSGYRASGYRSRFAEEFDDDGEGEEPAVPRSRDRAAERAEARAAERAEARAEVARAESARESARAESARAEAARAERGSVRSINRPVTPTPATPSVSYPTRDNLALAPQVQLRERAVVSGNDQRYQITTLHPTTYREARTIGEHFRDGVPVIINLTEMEEADARRLVDFAAGLAFGLRGTIERVTNRVFLLSPANVQVTAEDKAKIAEGGFFDQT